MRSKAIVKDDSVKNALGIIIVLAMIVLILSPIDFIPDIIPIIGWIDDLMYIIVIMAVISDINR